MSNQTEILNKAKQRALANQHSYAGALTPEEAHAYMQANPEALLVDVRSLAELELVGRVPNALHIEWAFYPGMVANPNFNKQLIEQIDKNSPVIFMCRTGGRSHNAAVVAASVGYTQSFNMLEGFEGDVNAEQQRTMVNGWKHASLPWTHAKK
ncbi:MAG: rhodanese-like domain-containing protein [Methylotenera sp.]|nr:rhodanese-like domain-containing protein [Methylotenera sp.]